MSSYGAAAAPEPAVLHTYNLAAVEYAGTAALAGVPVRVHAEHGRDAGDPHGLNRKHNLLRRGVTPFIDRYIPVSDDLQRWLRQVVGVPDAKTLMIANGVDTERFQPRPRRGARRIRHRHGRPHTGCQESQRAGRRLHPPARMLPGERQRLRLAIVGDGPLLGTIKARSMRPAWTSRLAARLRAPTSPN